MRRRTLLAVGSVLFGAAILLLIRIGFVTVDMKNRQQASLEITQFMEEAGQQQPWKNEASYQLLEEEIPLTKSQDKQAKAIFTTPEGIEIKSYSKYWTEEKLRQLYQELLKNKHGSEIEYLSEIIVHSGAEDKSVIGMQEEMDGTTEMQFHLSALPQQFSIYFSATLSTIHLYNGDTRRTVESMARTLSHEYGHHFTNYYMFKKMSGSEIEQSEYVKIRGLKNNMLRCEIVDTQDYMDYHQWYVFEIAAEDYVMLMGSPTVFQQYDFKDVRERLEYELEHDKQDDTLDMIDLAFNAGPQENMAIPLADEVEGLNEYFYSMLDEQAPQIDKEEKKTISIQIDKVEDKHHLVDGTATYTSYKINFNRPYTGKDVTYTLVAYDQNDNLLMPIKTMKASETEPAIIGNVAQEKDNYVYSLNDQLAEGTRRFRVLVMFGDDHIISSEPFDYTFGEES